MIIPKFPAIKRAWVFGSFARNEEGPSSDIDFKKDTKTYYACLYQFAVIGEAVDHMDPKLLERFEYPWYRVRSFRNFIMHHYHAIDEKVVWDTIEKELPEFRKLMEHVLEVS